MMKKLALLGVAAVISTVLATPLMAQEATQEPGMIGYNYPNSHYLTGGYGVRTPYNTGRYPHMFPPGVYVPAPVGVAVGGPVAIGVGPVGVAVAPSPYDSFAYYGPDW
jgi:hypothetical protein